MVFIICALACGYTYYLRSIAAVKSDVLDKRWYYNTVIFDFENQESTFKQDINDGVRLNGQIIIHPNFRVTMTSNFDVKPPLVAEPLQVSLVSRSNWELSGKHFITSVQDVVIKSRGSNPHPINGEAMNHLKLMHNFSLGLTREVVSVSDNFFIMSGSQGLTVFFAED